MKSFEFKQDAGIQYYSMGRTPRMTKYRAKCIHYPHDYWVVGDYSHVDDNRNDPFRSLPYKEKHFIFAYVTGDWNMGGWDNIEISIGTLQQNTGVKDENEKDIFEGDILKIYTQVSYDEDGTCNVGTEFIEGVVVYENGGFKLHNGIYLHEIDPWFNKVYIVDNIIESEDNQTAIDYRTKLLCDKFETNRTDVYPDLIDVAFLDLAKNAAKIPMDDFICDYDLYISEIRIIFVKDNVRYILSEYIRNDEHDEYDGSRYEITCSTGGCNSNNFEDIIEFVEKK
jgi:uncharacterized phage protein (TIGR01671 family)